MKYKIYKPSGNDTALVYGTSYSRDEKKKINDIIMGKHSNVEQVGFIDKEKKELEMAGNEFCGNASRCAAYEFLDGKMGDVQIRVNEGEVIKAGVDENNNAWCEIPLLKNKDFIYEKEKNIFIVELKGINMIILMYDVSKKYLSSNIDLKELCKSYIKKYNMLDKKAVGIVLLENIEDKIKINPIVWVKAIDTCFCETACGSGSMASCITIAQIYKKSQQLHLIQPSGMEIITSVDYDEGSFKNAMISGNIITDNVEYII